MKDHKALYNSDCRFCNHLKGKGVNRPIDMPWLQSEDFAAFISQGSFIEGWTIIVPKKHSLNMSEYYGQSSFRLFLSKVKGILEEQFDRCVLFEHGPLLHNSLTGCGTDHAHVHLVPTSVDIKEEVNAYDSNLIWSEHSLENSWYANQEYLLFSDDDTNGFMKANYCEIKSPRSQFFRKVLANSMGIPELFDYKRDPMLEIGVRSLEKLFAVKSIA
jgi:diadenosine tetraphosphate (Ap4A) HIT family hydrolase